ncbi:MAG TPA: hypothetical protein VGI47_02160 [Candidatus Binataceae bacterium]
MSNAGGGTGALTNITTGGANTAYGNLALQSDTTGAANEIRDGPFLALGFSNRSVQAVAQSMCAIKRRDPASLPIYFRSSIEWAILEARP